MKYNVRIFFRKLRMLNKLEQINILNLSQLNFRSGLKPVGRIVFQSAFGIRLHLSTQLNIMQTHVRNRIHYVFVKVTIFLTLT